MTELLSLLAVYYHCSEEAAHWRLTQLERFLCNQTYQQAKLLFLDEDARAPGAQITPEQNVEAYLRFKAWEQENADLVADMKSRKPPKSPDEDI